MEYNYVTEIYFFLLQKKVITLLCLCYNVVILLFLKHCSKVTTSITSYNKTFLKEKKGAPE